MQTKPLYNQRQYLKKVINTFLPKVIFRLSPKRLITRNYWASREQGDSHGYDKYADYLPCLSILVSEINMHSDKTSSVLDLGCNCGAYLAMLKKEGYTNLTGLDISHDAVEFGRQDFDLDGVGMSIGSFEEILPVWVKNNKKFDLVYSIGATIELVHPSFDIVRNLCAISRHTIILFINEWGHLSPRFYEYEFNRNGFLLAKCIRPWNGEKIQRAELDFSSLLIFERVE
jgi:SAM-dependent methyltransferase